MKVPFCMRPVICVYFQAKIWDIGRCLLQNTLTGHSAAIFAVDMNDNGSLVITGSADKVRYKQGIN